MGLCKVREYFSSCLDEAPGLQKNIKRSLKPGKGLNRSLNSNVSLCQQYVYHNLFHSVVFFKKSQMGKLNPMPQFS